MSAKTSPTSKLAKVSQAHTVWALGHTVVVAATLYTVFKLVTFGTPSRSLYKLAYGGALLSWGIVVYKTLGIPQPNKVYLQRFLSDENGEYLLLALFWFMTAPVYISLIPFATFSLFHTLTFVRTTFLPPSTPATKTSSGGQVQAQQPPNASRMIQTWVKKNYEPAMRFVAFTEAILILPYLVIGIVLRRTSLISVIFFAHFLRLRFHLSPQSREAFGYLNAQVDSVLAHPSVPDVVKQGITLARQLITRYANSVIQNPQAPAANAPVNGAR